MEQSSALVNKSLMVQVVIISALVMMGGSLFPKGKKSGSSQAEAEADAPDSDEPEQAGSAEFGQAATGPAEPSSSGEANPDYRARPNL